MKMLSWEIVPPKPEADPQPPLEGWHEPCDFEDHQWGLTVEEGRASLWCLDPCDADVYDPAGSQPACLQWWENDDLCTPEPIPVRPVFVDDSTPSGPWGPAEYGYWIDLKEVDANETR